MNNDIEIAEKILLGEEVNTNTISNPLLIRLKQAWVSLHEGKASKHDIAVLIRQILRLADSASNSSDALLPISDYNFPFTSDDWKAFGLEVIGDYVKAIP